MKKKIICLTVLFSLLFTGFINAEAKEVPKIEPEEISAKKKNWQPWIVAFVTVAVAATGLIIASRDKGKKTHD